MNHQKVINKVVRAMRKQGKGSYKLNNHGAPLVSDTNGAPPVSCRYRKKNGAKCLVGMLIKDKYYKKSLEDKAVTTPEVMDAVFDSGYTLDPIGLNGEESSLSFLATMQTDLHDELCAQIENEHGEDYHKPFLELFEPALKLFCDARDLKVPKEVV